MAKKKYYQSNSSGMIREDRSAFANLPQQLVVKYWPKNIYTMNESLDDTLRGVDQQIDSDKRGGKRKKGSNPSKY